MNIGDVVLAEVYDDDWRAGTIIGRTERANGQVFYRVSVRGSSSPFNLTAKRLRNQELLIADAFTPPPDPFSRKA